MNSSPRSQLSMDCDSTRLEWHYSKFISTQLELTIIKKY